MVYVNRALCLALAVVGATPAGAVAKQPPRKVTSLSGLVTYTEETREPLDDGRGVRRWRQETRSLTMTLSLRRSTREARAWTPVSRTSTYTGDYEFFDGTWVEYPGNSGCSTSSEAKEGWRQPSPLPVNVAGTPGDRVAASVRPLRPSLDRPATFMLRPEVKKIVSLGTWGPPTVYPTNQPGAVDLGQFCGMWFIQTPKTAQLAPAFSRQDRCTPAGVPANTSRNALTGTVFGVWSPATRTVDFDCDRVIVRRDGSRVASIVRGQLVAN